jgi:hypothetical protein
MNDEVVVQAFKNFLSWGERPVDPETLRRTREVPPAWWAYVVGATRWCPPEGEM